MSNTIGIYGNVGSDPELKQVGQADILEFSLADNTGYGEHKNTTWFRAKVFGKQAVSLQPLIKKGKPLFVTGEMSNREWTDKNGVAQKTLEIKVTNVTLCGGKEDDGNSTPSTPKAAASKTPAKTAKAVPQAQDDDLPF